MQQYNICSIFQACNNFENNGTCVIQCPPAEVYDPNLFQTVPNTNARLAAGDLCVLQCPGEQQVVQRPYSYVSTHTFPFSFSRLSLPLHTLRLCHFSLPLLSSLLEGLFELSGNCLLRCPDNYFSRGGQCIFCDGACPTGRQTPIVIALLVV